MARFTAIPAPPVFGSQEWEVRTLNAMKQNVDLLTGLRNEEDLASKALLTSTYSAGISDKKILDSVAPTASYALNTDSSANNGGITANVLLRDDAFLTLNGAINNGVLASDLDILRTDIANLRNTMNTIISVLRGAK